MAKRRKLHEISIRDDIRYRGPISYQGFQAVGWLCLVLGVALAILKLGWKLDPYLKSQTEGLGSVLTGVSSFSLPFLLLANFSRILTNSEGYKSQLLRTGGIAVAIFLGANLFFDRYIAGAVKLFMSDPGKLQGNLNALAGEVLPNRFFQFNVFVDLFLCTLFMYFLNARPKRVFTGKKIVILRLFALLPVAYELASLVLKGMAALEMVTLPVWSFALMTVKPPMTFVLFMILALHIKGRERLFCRHGRTHEEYQAFLGTNRNSLHFSIVLMILLIVTAIVDFLLMIFISAAGIVSSGAASDNADVITKYIQIVSGMGFGESIPQLFVAPLMLLYSYSRMPKRKIISMFIPVAGIALMLLVVLEGGFQLLRGISQRVDMTQLRQMFETIDLDELMNLVP